MLVDFWRLTPLLQRGSIHEPCFDLIDRAHLLLLELLGALRDGLGLLGPRLFHKFLGQWVDTFALVGGDLGLILRTYLANL